MFYITNSCNSICIYCVINKLYIYAIFTTNNSYNAVINVDSLPQRNHEGMFYNQ